MIKSIKNKIGIITGSGPEAGIDLWQKILCESRRILGSKFRGDLDAPHMIIHSIPDLGHSMELLKNKSMIWSILNDTMKKICRDVDFFCIACNTLHYFQDNIKSNILFKEKFVSVVDEIENLIKQQKIEKACLLGSRYVMDINRFEIFKPLKKNLEIEIYEDIESVHNLIYEIKKIGANNAKNIEHYQNILNNITSEVVILACTELPLINIDFGKKVINCNDVLAKALITKCKKK